MTPSEHYAAADRLMARVADMDPGLPIARNLTAQAHTHAILANYVPPPDHAFRDGHPSYRTRVARASEEFL